MNIIGYGYVGKSIGALFDRNHIMYQVNDPIPKSGSFLYYPPDKISKMIEYSESALNQGDNSVNYYFICVPTPSEEPTGRCNTSIVFSVVKELIKHCKNATTIIVKSTISPGTLEKLCALNTNTNVSIIFCPEFLRESYCIEDTLNSSYSIIGLPQKEILNKNLALQLEDLYKNILYPSTPGFKVIVRAATICELFKYTINVHLAVKVWYFNEINEVCEKMNVPYSELQSLFYLEPRLGKTHTNVPGHDGNYGFGLGCLPKETKSLTFVQKELGIPNNILHEITKRNESYFRRKSIA
jgi:nucleotide sugar dehydrogenase